MATCLAKEKVSSKTVPVVISAALVATLTFLLGIADQARAATTANGMKVMVFSNGAYFSNYDFLDEGPNSRRADNVDWATSLVFWNNAEINKVKGILSLPVGDFQNYGSDSTGAMYMETGHTDRNTQNQDDYYRYMIQCWAEHGSSSPMCTRDYWWNANWQSYWDDDNGKKYIACPLVGMAARHYRIYADGDLDYIYSPDWGYTTVATTHWDANECPPVNKEHYGSEEVEQHIMSVMEAKGHSIFRDYWYFYNYEPFRVEGNHTWENNGYVSFARID